MKIQDMFEHDIDRQINGVIKVDQAEDEVIEQELNEYVITRELKKHFITFFNYYSDTFDEATADTGVWISGFFGSGKSHFLKMLSYLLENREVKGRRSVEWFRDKFADDPATFMLIDKATKAETETILFNIDIEGSVNKDKTAVLRVFAKMFYNHLGFCGENLKVAMLEHYIDRLGKTEEFRRRFEERRGMSWLECRRAFAFHGKYIIPTLAEVLDMDEDDARAWFKDKSAEEFSIAQLAQDIREYIETKPKNFRLLFMVDEVGQYVGTDTDQLLNLQSLVEEIGSVCRGQAWVVCTGQEAIDEIIRVRSDEFSRIQARFKTRLSLSSSSVDEVIQKRILKKKKLAEVRLEGIYEENDSVLRNLFSFSESRLDIKGYGGGREFSEDFPFVPYQFIIMQKVFAEIRKHGNSGKHLSGGERSMLSGFQEAAQQVEGKDEYALVPFYRFYDTVHSFLDSSIRRVIERCEKAADNGDGIQPQDVDVLKLLYLIRYIDDIPANLDNIVILMADDIRLDKIEKRRTVGESLNRLLSQNYIGRTGEFYNFLTDEEQDVQREISNTNVDTNAIVMEVGSRIFGDIFDVKKFRCGKDDFVFDRKVDTCVQGAVTGGMCLQFLTLATDATEKTELHLLGESQGRKAIVVLAETPYYESLEKAKKIEKYVKQHNVNQLPKSVQDIIRVQQDEARRYCETALVELKKAIEDARFYVAGERREFRGGDARSKIERAMEYLVSQVYSRHALIGERAESEREIVAALRGGEKALAGLEPNREAADDMYEYLEIQESRRLPTSMADIRNRYSGIPYGWRGLDIAVVAAQLIRDRRAVVKYQGATIQPDDPKLPDLLYNKSEAGKVSISKRYVVDQVKLRAAREMLRDYFDVMDVPNDEDGLVAFVVERFTAQREHYAALEARYQGHNYPDYALVDEAKNLVDEVLAEKKDNTALIGKLLAKEDSLLDSKDEVQRVEIFFKNQVQIFDEATDLLRSLEQELVCLQKEEESYQALNTIRLYVQLHGNEKTIYHRIPELNGLMATVRAGHDRLLADKRAELREVICQCMERIQTLAGDHPDCEDAVKKADRYYTDMEKQIARGDSIVLLDGLAYQIYDYKDKTCDHIEAMKKPAPPKPTRKEEKQAKPLNIKTLHRQAVFPGKTLYTQADVDAYLEQVRRNLSLMLGSCDGIKLN